MLVRPRGIAEAWWIGGGVGLLLASAGMAIGWARVALGLTHPAGLLGSLAVGAAAAVLLRIRPGETTSFWNMTPLSTLQGAAGPSEAALKDTFGR